MIEFDLKAVNRYVLKKQYLDTGSPGAQPAPPAQIVAGIAGLHATVTTTPYFSLKARMPAFEQAQLHHELYIKPKLIKVRCMRKTIFLQTLEMLPTVYRATSGLVTMASQRYMSHRGVSPADYAQLSKRIIDLLEERPLTAPAIKAALGTDLDVSSILYTMCDRCLLVRWAPVKGWKDKRHSYARFSQLFPEVELESLSEVKATASLVKCYLSAFGPARLSDVVWWTGLGKRSIKRALNDLADQIAEVNIRSVPGTHFILSAQLAEMQHDRAQAEPVANLLPALDPYIMGYKHRDRLLDEAHAGRVLDRSGNACPTVLVDGRIVGIWDLGQDLPPAVKLHFLVSPTQAAVRQVRGQAREIGRFATGREVEISICDDPIPLRQRPAGAFMSPLR